MRKIITTTFVTLDGVVQAPGAPHEDTSNGFAFGGWAANYSDTDALDIMNGFMSVPFELLLGKRLFTKGTQADGFKLVDHKITAAGVIVATYEPAGPLVVGTVDP